jgi:hypothetical protein
MKLVGADGKTRFERTLPWEGGGMHGPDIPLCKGVLLDGDRDRAIFRVLRETDNEHYEEWRCVRWSTGEEISIARVQSPFSEAESRGYLMAARHIEGTPLIACCWLETSKAAADPAIEQGAHFVVTDFDARPVWNLVVPKDYAMGEDSDRNRRLSEWMWDGGPLPQSKARNRFDVVLAAAGQRVTFEVTTDGASKTGWIAREVGRQPCTIDLRTWTEMRDDAVRKASPLSLELLGATDLKCDGPEPLEPYSFEASSDGVGGTSHGEVECSFIDPSGRFLLADKSTHAVHVFGSDCRRLAICRLAPTELGQHESVRSIAVSASGNIHVGFGDYAVSKYAVFDSSGKRIASEKIDGASVFEPGQALRWNIGRETIGLLDRDGLEKKRIARTPSKKWIDLPGSAGVAADGSLAVIVRNGVHVYSPVGEPVASLDLPIGMEYARVALSDRHIFLAWLGEVWSIELATHKAQRAELGGEFTKGSPSCVAWRADSSELWILDERGKRVLRYRVKE